MTKNGIDVSYHQNKKGHIDWKKVKESGVEYAIIRAGYGKNTVDEYFIENIVGAHTAGIKVGVYWFIYALNEADAIENAKRCIDTIALYKDIIELKVWCDYEYDSDSYSIKKDVVQTKESRTRIVKAFLHTLEEYGYDVGLYANPDYLKNKFLDLSEYPLWLAYYTNNESEAKKYNPMIWQYSSKGSVPGINGNVDMNVFCTDLSEKENNTQTELTPRIYKKGVATQLSKNFKSTEFDCNGKNCCNETPINPELINVLQIVRNHFGVSVNINCGYRCPEHNARVRGASKTSKHMDGIAADITVKGVHPYQVARFLETLDFKGRIGCYTWNDSGNGFVHVDVRGKNSRAIYTENNTAYDTVDKFSQTVKKGMKGQIVKVVQRKLKTAGLYTGAIDGSCGAGTEKGIIKWNEKYGRLNDSKWGPKCWNESFPY